MKIKGMLLIVAILFNLRLSTAAETPVAELKKAVVAIGKLDFTRDVPIRYFNRDHFKYYLDDLFSKDYSQELSENEEDFLVLMGFINRKVGLKELRRQIILENAGGLYNEKTKELVALEDFRHIDIFNSLALIHELRHAIQDQHFNLAKILGEYSDYDDRRLAVLAAIEGDATLVMLAQMGIDAERLTSAFTADSLLSFSSLLNAPTLPTAPPIVQYQLVMPYSDGLKFVSAIYQKKSWTGVNRILALPPVSSAQILHPEKYLINERPPPVSIRYRPRGFGQEHNGVIGEYFLNVLLHPLSNEQDLGDVAKGWQGDQYVIFRNSESYMIVWKSIWETDSDCSRFYKAFKQFVEKHFEVEWQDQPQNPPPFFAGKSQNGFFLLRQFKNTIFYTRANNRDAINDLIASQTFE